MGAARLAGIGVFVRNQNALWTELDGQFLVMNIENGAYYEVAGVGGAIWRLLDVSRSETEIVDLVVGRYSVDREECARDVRAFLEKLLAANMVSEAVAAADGSASSSAG